MEAPLWTLLADAARAKPAFDVVVRLVKARAGAALDLASLCGTDHAGRATTGLKKVARIVEKAQLRPEPMRGKCDAICDVVR